MNHAQAANLGEYVRTRRHARGQSAANLAKLVGTDAAQILRLERGEVASPRATLLGSLAEHLGVPVNDLLVLAGYPISRSLPTIAPYLREKYPSLTEEDIFMAELFISARTGLLWDEEET